MPSKVHGAAAALSAVLLGACSAGTATALAPTVTHFSNAPSSTRPASPAPSIASDTPPPLPSALPSPTAIEFEQWGPGRVEIPILLYHHLSVTGGGSRYTLNSDVFRQQMEFLVAAGFQTVSVSDVARAIRVGAELPANPIALTFDDGNADTINLAFPILDSMDLRGVAYVVANRTGAEGFMGEKDLQTLSAAGWEIGSHSMSHVDLTQGGPTLWRQEILVSRLDLEAVLGVPVLTFAYPFGTSTPEIIAKVAEYGYDSGAGLGPSTVNDRGTLYYLQRREIWGTWSEEQFEAILTGDGG